MKRIVRVLLAFVMATAAGSVGLSAAVNVPAGADSDGYWDYRSVPVSGTYKPITGNFAGDDATDIIWYAPGAAADSLWIGNSGQRGKAAFDKIPLTINAGYTPLVGDFAGSGSTYDDVVWYAPGTAPDRIWIATGDVEERFDSQPLTISGVYRPTVIHDFLSDTKDRILWYRPGTASDAIWAFDSDGSHRSYPVGITGDLQVVPADFNGDGVQDLLLYTPGTGSDVIWTSTLTGPVTKRSVKINGRYQAVPVHTEDGFDNVFFYGSGSAPDVLWRNTAGAFAGQPVDYPVVGVAQDTPVIGFAVVYSPSDVESALYDDGTTAVGDYLTDDGHDIQAGFTMLGGDFDNDSYVDLFWYGPGSRPDKLWYTEPPADGAGSARSAHPAGRFLHR